MFSTIKLIKYTLFIVFIFSIVGCVKSEDNATTLKDFNNIPNYYYSIPGERPYIGNKDADVIIEEFTDFQCPYCAKSASSIDTFFDKYPEYKDKIKIEFYNFPLPTHQYAYKAAEASLCANDQSKFWQFHNLLFKNYDKINIELINKIATDINLDINNFNECLNGGKYSDHVQRDIQKGINKKVTGTPTYFINNARYEGFMDVDRIKKIIDEIIK